WADLGNGSGSLRGLPRAEAGRAKLPPAMTTPDVCLTCYGRGETASEHGVVPCPDCFGDGKPPRRGARLEWRLRGLERGYRPAGGGSAGGVLGLGREARGAAE